MSTLQDRPTADTGRAEIRLDEIPVGEGRTVTLGNEQVAVFRLRGSDGEPAIRAVSAVCPHLGGPIADGQVDAGKVVCPLHLHTYDLTDGESLTGQPALKVYPVEIADGKIVVSTG
jgi:nitrite reductase (NADH) small subunit